VSAIGARAARFGAGSTLLAPLRSRDYLLFWLGTAVSQAGDQFQMVALAILTLDLTGSAGALGAVLTVQAVPRTLLMLFGGVATDRFRPRSILLWCNALLFVAAGALSSLAATGALALWHLYGYALAAGILYAFSVPAQQAIVPELVPADRIRSATALRTTTFNLTMFLVPPLAGLVVAGLGVAPAFTVNAASFGVAAVCVLGIRASGVPRSPASSGPLAQLREGLAVTWRAPVLLIAIVSATVYSLGYEGASLVGIPALVKLSLGGGDGTVGLLYGVCGAGALVGTLAIGAMSRVPRLGLVAASALVATGVGLAAAGLASSLWLAASLLAVASALQAVCVVTYVTIVQTQAPPEVRGRVMALFFLGVMGLAPLSLGLGGLIADALGPRAVFLAGGAAVAGAGLYSLARGAFRRVV
jgi:MFS family permease